MPRSVKTFSQVGTQKVEAAVPKTNTLTLDLGGLNLNENQLQEVRQQAVKAAMLATNDILSKQGLANALDSFSTFSTFSTFASGGAFGRPDVLVNVPIIDKILSPGVIARQT